MCEGSLATDTYHGFLSKKNAEPHKKTSESKTCQPLGAKGFHLLNNHIFRFPLLVLKGIYHYSFFQGSQANGRGAQAASVGSKGHPHFCCGPCRHFFRGADRRIGGAEDRSADRRGFDVYSLSGFPIGFSGFVDGFHGKQWIRGWCQIGSSGFVDGQSPLRKAASLQCVQLAGSSIPTWAPMSWKTP